MKYTRKPVAVDAMQFTGTLDSFNALVKWAARTGIFSLITEDTGGLHMMLTTGDGKYGIISGGWVVNFGSYLFQAFTSPDFTANFDAVK